MKKSFILLMAAGLLFCIPALAQTEATVADENAGEDPFVSDTATALSVDPAAEGLTDADLTQDLAAEALPTANRIRFMWENVRHNIASVMTFNAEKKAAFLRFRLHQLDRKMAACAELGDEQCAAKIERRIQELTHRTEQYIAQRESLKAAWLERFQAWRERREELIAIHQERAIELKDQRKELGQMRREQRPSAQAGRRQRLDEISELRRQALKERRALRPKNQEQRLENRDEARDLRQNQVEQRQDIRQQNQRKLIELRHQEAAKRLEAAEKQVEDRQTELLNDE